MNAKISIIIATYFRPELLNLGLSSLCRQIFPLPYEIIVLNDGLPTDETEAICNKYKKYLNIRYVFVGQRNLNGIKWRVPGAVFNEGVKLAQGDFIILSSAEIYHLDIQNIKFLIEPLQKDSNYLTIPFGKNDDGKILTRLKNGFTRVNISWLEHLDDLNTKLPFCLGMHKSQFTKIGGFDSGFFEGYCFDDDDFIDRLIKSKCVHHQTEGKIVHLYHSRSPKDRIGLIDRDILWKKNQQLYLKKQISKDIINIEQPSKSIDIVPEVKSEIITPKEVEPIITKSDKWYLEKIPKIAHFYWGEKKLPYLRYLSIWSFYKHNPDWEIRFYYPKYRVKEKSWKTHEHQFKFTGKDYFSKLKKLPIKFIEVDCDLIGFRNDVSGVYKANYLEYYILNTIGGMFSDTDILYFASMNKISVNNYQNRETTNIFSILWHGHTMGFLLSAPNNPIYQLFISKLPSYFKNLENNYQCIGTLMIDNLIGKNINEVQKKFSDLKIINLLPETIYAYDISKIKEIFQLNPINRYTSNSIGLHWYGGYPASMKAINKLNADNIKVDTFLSKTIELALGNKPLDIKNSDKLTIHCVVKNEPFIYYCIKSVYPYAKKILLYDTGSYDKHTLEDIQLLLKEDTEGKIIFKEIPIDIDESMWTMDNLNNMVKESKGKFTVGSIRQLMIEQTDTEYFMIVDGDEVHYKQTMEAVINKIIPTIPDNIYLVATPINWFYDLTHTFTGAYTFPFSGGIYKTDKVIMNDISPNEHHLIKETKEILCQSKHKMNWAEEVIPYAHFETFLKPYRRKGLIKPEQIIEFKGKLPEVMIENNYYINRYLEENK